MPRYFFNLINGEHVSRDPVGVELPSSSEAFDTAWDVAQELKPELDPDMLPWRLEVTDENGNVVASALLAGGSGPALELFDWRYLPGNLKRTLARRAQSG